MDFREMLTEKDEKYSQGNGKKQFYTMDNVGSAKYTINFNDGIQTHGDGSAFLVFKLSKIKRSMKLELKSYLIWDIFKLINIPLSLNS